MVFTTEWMNAYFMHNKHNPIFVSLCFHSFICDFMHFICTRTLHFLLAMQKCFIKRRKRSSSVAQTMTANLTTTTTMIITIKLIILSLPLHNFFSLCRCCTKNCLKAAMTQIMQRCKNECSSSSSIYWPI